MRRQSLPGHDTEVPPLRPTQGQDDATYELCIEARLLRLAADFGPPPADTHEKEAPVVEELGRLAFEGVADELEGPPEKEEEGGVEPEAVQEDAGEKDGYGNKNGGYAQRVAGTVDGVLVAGGVLGDPLLAGAVA